jgi:hypothetical protein
MDTQAVLQVVGAYQTDTVTFTSNIVAYSKLYSEEVQGVDESIR